MAPNTQTATPRRPGRPKKVALSPAAAPVASETPRRRGRQPKAATVQVAAEAPKKRGRPARVEAEEAAPVVQNAPKRGRPAKTAAPEPVTEEAPAPKKRGRPAKNAPTVDLKRVAGSPRVAKRSSPLSKPAPRASKPVAPASRINPRLRSKLRARVPAAQKTNKEEPAPPAHPAKKRGRPAKAVQAPAPNKMTARKAIATKAKAAAPRKRRGYTSFEIPDKFAAQVQQFIQDLHNAESSEEQDAAQVDAPAEENLNATSSASPAESEDQDQDQTPETDSPRFIAEQGEEQTGRHVDLDVQEEHIPAEPLQQDQHVHVDTFEKSPRSPADIEIESTVQETVHEAVSQVVDLQVGSEKEVFVQETTVDNELEL